MPSDRPTPAPPSATTLGGQAARSAPLAVLDLEMTGLSERKDRICEVAVVRGAGGTVDHEYHSLVRPSAEMSPGALACHGLTSEILSDAPQFDEIAVPVTEVLQQAAVVAHNVPFDLCFLQRELEEAGHPMVPGVTVDTLLMARRLFAFRHNNLGQVCDVLGVPLDNAHRALDDARATFSVFTRMMEIVDPRGDVTLGELNALVDALAPNSPLRLRQRKTLRQAHREGRSVWIEYQSTGDPTEGAIRREVDVWFVKLPRVQGWCHVRKAERVFRLDRMNTVALGERTFEVPADAKARI
jgi:DNA polymerase-3 subunit epsilon